MHLLLMPLSTYQQIRCETCLATFRGRHICVFRYYSNTRCLDRTRVPTECDRSASFASVDKCVKRLCSFQQQQLYRYLAFDLQLCESPRQHHICVTRQQQTSQAEVTLNITAGTAGPQAQTNSVRCAGTQRTATKFLLLLVYLYSEILLYQALWNRGGM